MIDFSSFKSFWYQLHKTDYKMSFLRNANHHVGIEPPCSANLFETTDSSAQHQLLSFLQPEAALVISTAEDDLDTPGTGLPHTAATALISTWTFSPTSASFFDHGQSDTLLSDHQYSAAVTHGGSFVVLEQPGADKYFLPADQITVTSDAGSQCLLEVGHDGSDYSGEEAEGDAQYNAAFPAVQCGNSEETRRKERRREQNRRAARRCRARRKMREAAVVREVEKEMETKRYLEREVQRLSSQKQELEVTLRRHGVFFIPRAAAVSPGHCVVTPEDVSSLTSGCYNLPLPAVPETFSPDFGVEQLFDEL